MSSVSDFIKETLEKSDLFSSYTSQESGVKFYILSEKEAPVQQGFYFTNSGMSKDKRYLWFYCAYPPSRNKSLGVIDFKEKEINYFPETQFSAASPYVDSNTGEIYWGSGPNIWKRSPHKKDRVELVNSLPSGIVKNKNVSRMATHLTRSADKKYFFIDAQVGLQYIFGRLPVNGDDFEYWHTFDRNYNHAQLSPVDSEVVLFAQEFHSDPLTGLRFPIKNRMWMMEAGGSPFPLLKEEQRPKENQLTHEWWDPDGEHVWCVWGHHNQTWKVNINTREVVNKIKFPQKCWHSHSSSDANYIVGDSSKEFYRGCPSSVNFLNRNTGKVTKIVNNPEKLDHTGKNYHIDPHPRFCGNDEYIIFTTTVRGEVDLAIIPVKELLK